MKSATRTVRTAPPSSATWPNPTRSLALLLSVLPFGNLSTTAATPGRQAATDPGIQLLSETLTAAGGGVQTGAGIVHVTEMTSIHSLPARSSEADVDHLGGFIPQGGIVPQRDDDVRILWITRTGPSEAEIGWTSNPTASYTVQAADLLPATDWIPVDTVVAEAGTSTLIIPIGPTSRFFRVQQLP